MKSCVLLISAAISLVSDGEKGKGGKYPMVIRSKYGFQTRSLNPVHERILCFPFVIQACVYTSECKDDLIYSSLFFTGLYFTRFADPQFK